MNKRTRNIAIGGLVAGAMGYVAGILTAPKSGEETRRSLNKAGTKGIAEAEKQLKNLHTELSKLLGEVEEVAKQARTSDGREELVGDVVSKASNAKQKTREILSAIHDGTADDRDLDKAVVEASKAIKSIRKYLQK